MPRIRARRGLAWWNCVKGRRIKQKVERQGAERHLVVDCREGPFHPLSFVVPGPPGQPFRFSASNTFSDVMGSDVMRTPQASATALAMAPAVGMLAVSPMAMLL